MAISLSKVVERLPEGTMTTVGYGNQTYQYGAFFCESEFLIMHPRFNWLQHIEESFYSCFAGTMNRFMKVV